MEIQPEASLRRWWLCPRQAECPPRLTPLPAVDASVGSLVSAGVGQLGFSPSPLNFCQEV